MKKNKINISPFYTVWATFILIVAGIYIVAFKILNLYFPDWTINFSGVITVVIAFILTLIFIEVTTVRGVSKE